MNYKPILIVAGEPNSVFLEIFFKSIKRNHYNSPLIILVNKKLLIEQMKYLGFNFKINQINIDNKNLNKLNNKSINIINVNYNYKKIFEKISPKSNRYINESFLIALKILKKNGYTKLINGPISKKNFLKEKYLGITEYLAAKTNTQEFSMLIYNKKLSVSPITTHLPLKDVSKNISEIKIINHVKLITEFYNNIIRKKIKIAVTGLNPHCESNYNSSEEEKIIKPAITQLKKAKYNVNGPFPADTIFMKEHLKKYDVIIGMFHDQVLAPAKTLFGFKAINITLGLPFIRISPDHGPNFEMIGKNISKSTSLTMALKFLDK
ncbi:4-hydroxythreonine-4-phosphate dehydrogenase PdxA [Candidatus Pelagibacter sp.]|nr:4-hydroxythreonine-4-phosphate dehydrogenase PdxA [Candidatus Pelagibacter sp.]